MFQFKPDTKDHSIMKKSLVVLTDIGRDHDDELALIVMAALLKLELIDLKAIITTLKPSYERAQLAKGVLDTLGIRNIPIGVGSNIDENYSIQPYEFNASYMSEPSKFATQDELLREVFKNAPDSSIDFLLIAGLTDANQFIKENLKLAKQKIKKVVIMGGFSSDNEKHIKDKDGFLIPDTSYNNNVDMASAKELYKLLQENNIPIVTVTKQAAMACAISPQFYEELAATKSPLGIRLSDAQSGSIKHLWHRVFLKADDPLREGLPGYCNKEWFLKTFTKNLPEYSRLTQEDSVWPYVNKLNAYDPIALLAMVFPDMFDPKVEIINDTAHHEIGFSPEQSGVNKPEEVRDLLLKLAKIGLLNESSHNKKLHGFFPTSSQDSEEKPSPCIQFIK